MEKCEYHSGHEVRLKNLEADVIKNEKSIAVLLEKVNNINPKLWTGVLALIGVCFSTIGSFLGVVLVAYLKTKGMLP